MRRLVLVAAIVLAALLPTPARAGAVLHVRPGGNDAQDGSSWSTAKATVTAAIAAAAAGDEIWVAEGTYAERIRNRIAGGLSVDVALYGGFDGTETAREQRDFAAHRTILDGGGAGIVVTIDSSAGPGMRLDGFVVTGGNAIQGGGIKIVGSAPVIANNVIRYNRTDGAGAGISVWAFNPILDLDAVITHNTIVDNYSYEAEGDGGGIACIGASPEISHNVIARNRANQNGGGIVCWAMETDTGVHSASPTIADNFILANSASLLDGGSTMNFGGGAIFASATDMTGAPIGATSEPIIVNNVIAANGAFLGGGIALYKSPFGAATVVNNTIVANVGAGIDWVGTAPLIANNVIAFNSWGLHRADDFGTGQTLIANDVYGNQVRREDRDYVNVPEATGSDGNLSVDPRLAHPGIGDLHLEPGSPCIDGGSTARVVAGWADIDGGTRVLGAAVDIGADEWDGTDWNPAAAVIRVEPGGDDALDGHSWATAKATVAAAIAAARESGGEVWVAEGTYTEHVTVPAFVYLYGGFAGTETARAERDVAAHPTILDGGGIPVVVRSENAGYLVSALDGFTVQNGGHYTGGDLGQVVPQTAVGGGIYSLVSGPIVSGNTIRRNSVGSPLDPLSPKPAGGGIGGYLSRAWIVGNAITENEVLNIDGQGGAMWFKLSEPLIEDNWIGANRAKYGAAFYGATSSPRLSGNRIESNEMYNWTGLISGSSVGAVDLDQCSETIIDRNEFVGNVGAVGGALALMSDNGARVEGNLFRDNRSWDYSAYNGGLGGAIYVVLPGDPWDDLYFVNNTFVGNEATHSIFGERGGAIALAPVSTRITIANNVMYANSSGIWLNPGLAAYAPTLEANALYNAGANYLNLETGPSDWILYPGFVDPGGGDFRLGSSSQVIDLGVNARVMAGIADLAGAARIVDGDYDGTATVDLGALERPRDRDDDGILDATDPDDDGDGVLDASDNCAVDSNAGQDDLDGDHAGDACDPDVDGDGVVEHPLGAPSRLPFQALDVTAAASTLAPQPANAYLYVAVYDATTDGLGWWNATSAAWLDSTTAPYRKPLAIYVDTNSCSCIDLGAGDTLTLTTDAGPRTVYLPDQPAGWRGWLFVAADGATYFDSALSSLARRAPEPGRDNCPVVRNPAQTDLDADGEGDLCDLDDGRIFFTRALDDEVGWQAESGFTAWNVYGGDMSVLRATGVYTQLPGSSPLAWQECGLAAPEISGTGSVGPNALAFVLVSGVGAGGEGSLGQDSTGAERPNDHPCP